MKLSFLQNLENVERKLSKRFGPFALFAVIHREGSPDRWDVVVSADWLVAKKLRGVAFMARQIKAAVSEEDMRRISRIAVLNPKDLAFREMVKTFRRGGNNQEVFDVEFGRVHVDHGYLISSLSANAAHKQEK